MKYGRAPCEDRWVGRHSQQRDCRAKVPEEGMSLVCSVQSKGAAWLEQS